MEEELIIIDNDNCDSMNASHSHNDASTDASIQQSNEKPQSEQQIAYSKTNGTFGDGRRRTCKICSKNLSIKLISKHHRMVHNMCLRCRQIFSTSVELTVLRIRCRNRRKTKTGNNNYDCNLCNKSFPYPSNLKTHLQTIHDPNYNMHRN